MLNRRTDTDIVKNLLGWGSCQQQVSVQQLGRENKDEVSSEIVSVGSMLALNITQVYFHLQKFLFVPVNDDDGAHSIFVEHTSCFI